MGWSPFARHYSGSRDFFPFLQLLRCVTSLACLRPPYVFRRGYARITTRGLPHSEIRGSKVVQHLTAAYRSRPRPSSAPGAKASTACPSYLDDRKSTPLPLCSFQGTAGAPANAGSPREVRPRVSVRANAAGPSGSPRRTGRARASARALPRSLKAEQHGTRGAHRPRRTPFEAWRGRHTNANGTRLSRPLVSGLLPAPRGRGSSTAGRRSDTGRSPGGTESSAASLERR